MTKDNAIKNAAEEGRRGDEALAEATHLFAGGFYNGAVSRAYYAAFHWARALLVTHGLQTKTHRGVIQLLLLHFVKSGLLTDDTVAHLAHLENHREVSDYTSAADFTANDAQEEINRAAAFIKACQPLMAQSKKRNP